jgi:hypothetical protein
MKELPRESVVHIVRGVSQGMGRPKEEKTKDGEKK